tara:strand:- start:30685 stop:32055 length:1371 start_codon:yes stop_codon:yes gene_type:complete
MGLLEQSQFTYYSTPSEYGNYQFVTLDNIINAFVLAYTGEGKLITKVNRTDVQFHAMRAIQELSYDVLRAIKTQEIEVPNTLKMILPHDYVNYVKISKVDTAGTELNLYATGKTSNPFAIDQQADGSYTYNSDNDKRRFTVRIPENPETSINDGDFLYIPYIALSDSLGYMGNPVMQKAHFIFETAGGFAGNGPYPVDSDWPRFGIRINPGDTHVDVANKLANKFADFGHHTVISNVNGLLTVEYSDGYTHGGGTATTPNSMDTEGAYTESTNPASGGANNTNIVITIPNAGGAPSSGVLNEQSGGSDSSQNFQNIESQTQDITSSDASDIELDYRGRRYGLDPQYAHRHGSFYIDYLRGYIHFSSALVGQTIVLKYISDGLGTDEEMVVHKFCEEAIYKWIAYGIVSTRSNIPDSIIARFKMEKFAETRKAKIRLSNIKIEEFTQILRGMGKQIK